MAPSKQSARAFVVGLGALGVFAVILLVAFTAQEARLPWTVPTTLVADFQDVGQLVVGSDVRQNGRFAGKVAEITLVDGHPRVTMQLSSDALPIYRDAYAGIWDQSSLAQKFVELRVGNPASGPLGNAVLPMSQTESTHDISTVLDVFDPPTRAALGNGFRQLGGVAGYGAGFHSFLADWPGYLRDTRTITVDLASDRTNLPGLLRSTDRVASRFTGREQQLGELLRNLDVTLRAVGADNAGPLAATITKLPGTLRATRAALDNADLPLADLAVATDRLRSGSDALGHATPDVRGVFREARRPFGHTPDFSDDAKPAVSDLHDTFSDLRPFVPRLGNGLHAAVRPLTYLKPYRVDLGTFFTDLDGLIRGHEGWTHQFRAYVAGPTLTSLSNLPINDSAKSYLKPGEAYFLRDKNGAFIPGDPGN
ncbi:MAG TPA: MlaD family protein [Pseudonocardia sp.]|jgi:phospholipid/cholesterol/gamma-HCH transport system substrate-binding protein